MWKYSQLYVKFRKLAPSPQSFHLLAMVLLTGYFAENSSPPDTTKAEEDVEALSASDLMTTSAGENFRVSVLTCTCNLPSL